MKITEEELKKIADEFRTALCDYFRLGNLLLENNCHIVINGNEPLGYPKEIDAVVKLRLEKDL